MNKAEFFGELTSKKVGIIGLGVSHFDLVCLLLKKGVDLTVLDKREISDLGEQYGELKALGAKFLLGQDYLESLTDFDIIFRTPGMYFFSEKLTDARKNGVVVTSEMEVFLDICPCKVYGVTGSDGKTTTTTLIGEMLKAEGYRVHVGGNIGKALLPLVEEIGVNDRCVVELSSFQLGSMRQGVDVAVITNIAPNHLDVHKDMAEYITAKVNLIAHQNAFSRTVLNRDNEETFQLSDIVRGEACYFSTKTPPYNGSYLDRDGYLVRVKNGAGQKILRKSEIKLPGMHNVENYLGAIAAVSGEVGDQAIIQVATEFGGVEHRIEYVKTIEGVRYYNDSIATSPTRTIAGLNAFDQKLIIIAGGYDKKIPYEPLAPVLCERVKILILLGATAKKIEEAVRGCNQFKGSELQIFNVTTLEEAVETAKKLAVEGDIVSLSPASASFDLYKNFEQRGQHFKRILAEM